MDSVASPTPCTPCEGLEWGGDTIQLQTALKEGSKVGRLRKWGLEESKSWLMQGSASQNPDKRAQENMSLFN